jgi:gas vesicle protein
MLVALLGGAALGAMAVAIATSKTGMEFRNRLRKLGSRLRGQAEASDLEEGEVAVTAFI